MERDILLERLEKKLAEKEKELEELRKMVSSNAIEEIKREIMKEMEERYRNLEAKLKELSKTVENLMSDVFYLKSELKTSREKRRDLVEIKTDDEEGGGFEEEDDIIVVD